MASVSFGEFLWALNTVSSRHIVLHDHKADEDPNLLLMMMPLMDMVNHSSSPNVGIMPIHDKMTASSYLVMRALRDIEENEQLTISYGNLSNLHFIQKYGFT